jgi:hypothetical protein
MPITPDKLGFDQPNGGEGESTSEGDGISLFAEIMTSSHASVAARKGHTAQNGNREWPVLTQKISRAAH